MRAHTKILAGLFVVLTAGWLAGCNGTIDDADSAPVVLEVENMTIPPVNATTDPLTGCAFTVVNSNATFKNKPKNAVAGVSPFNDINLLNVVVLYAWDDGLGVTGPETFGVGGSVPAGGSSPAQFSVVNSDDLLNPDRQGHTANLVMTFNGVTVAGDPVSVTTGGSLVVNTCQ